MKEDLKILTIEKIAVLLEIIYLLLKIDLEKMEDMELIPQKEKVFMKNNFLWNFFFFS